MLNGLADKAPTAATVLYINIPSGLMPPCLSQIMLISQTCEFILLFFCDQRMLKVFHMFLNGCIHSIYTGIYLLGVKLC